MNPRGPTGQEKCLTMWDLDDLDLLDSPTLGPRNH